MSRTLAPVSILLATALSVGCSVMSPGPAAGKSHGYDDVTVGLTTWFPDVKAAVRAGGNKAIHDSSIGNALDVAEMGVNGRVEMWDGDKGYIIDGQYLDMGNSSTVPGGRISSHFRDETIDLMVAERYAISDDGTNGPAPMATVMGGVRVRRSSGRLSDSSGNHFDEQDEWIEPVIGGQLDLPTSDSFAFVLRGDASGFGLGSGSKLTWNAFAGGAFDVDVSNTITLGWRVYDINYNRNSGASEAGLDGRFNGPSLSWIFAY